MDVASVRLEPYLGHIHERAAAYRKGLRMLQSTKAAPPGPAGLRRTVSCGDPIGRIGLTVAR